MRFILISALILASSLFVSAKPEQTGEYSLAGTVTNAATGEPIKRALVAIMHFDASRSASKSNNLPKTWTTFTDVNGTFRFDGLPGGNYSIHAQKPGFNAIPGISRTGDRSIISGSGHVDLSASREDCRIALSPLGVITGKIVDQDGLPVRGVNVLALTARLEDGLRQFYQERSVPTDDGGTYRLWNLRPGKYYIKAAGRASRTALYAGDVAPQMATTESFAATYFGGGSDISTAVPVEIAAGADAQADLSLTMQPAYRIRGRVANFVPQRTAEFRLLAGDDDVTPGRISVNEQTGAFEIENIVPGAYTLHVVQDQAAGESPVLISSSDVNGVVVPLAPAVSIRIITRLTGTPAAAHSNGVGDVRVEGCSAFARPIAVNGTKARALAALASTTERPGAAEPEIAGVFPGRYRMSVACGGAYVRSAMWGSQDVLANPTITIAPGVPPPSLEILAARGGGTVSGTVTAKEDMPWVLLVPQFAESTGPVMAAAIPADAGGQREFYFANVAPGSYVAYAFSSNDVEYRNPEFLKALSGGVAVRVEDSGQHTIKIAEVIR